MKRILDTSVMSAAVLVAAPALSETTLTVYTAFEAEQLPELKAAFEKVNPDIKIDWIRDSTGIITTKLLSVKQSAA